MFTIFNYTDGVYALCEPVKTYEEAVQAEKNFRARFALQGYYTTARWERINPADIELEIQEV